MACSCQNPEEPKSYAASGEPKIGTATYELAEVNSVLDNARVVIGTVIKPYDTKSITLEVSGLHGKQIFRLTGLTASTLANAHEKDVALCAVKVNGQLPDSTITGVCYIYWVFYRSGSSSSTSKAGKPDPKGVRPEFRQKYQNTFKRLVGDERDPGPGGPGDPDIEDFLGPDSDLTGSSASCTLAAIKGLFQNKVMEQIVTLITLKGFVLTGVDCHPDLIGNTIVTYRFAKNADLRQVIALVPTRTLLELDHYETEIDNLDFVTTSGSLPCIAKCLYAYYTEFKECGKKGGLEALVCMAKSAKKLKECLQSCSEDH